MRAALLIALVGTAVGNQADTEVNANPIRKVVTMLQAMQKKVEAEASKDKELYDKFMCYCKTGSADLEKSISDANIKVPALGSDIEEAENKVATLKEELKQAQMDRSAAKTAMEEATALREKEAAAFAKTSTELKANIAALTKAVTAIDNGMAGGFLQTDTAALVKKMVTTANLDDADREDLMSFFAQGNQYAPQSGEISGILKTMNDEMKSNLKSATDDENNSIKSYEDLMAAKKKEVQALTTQIEAKLSRVGELGIEIVQMKNDLSDTEEALLENTKFLSDLKKDCSTKSDEYNEIVKTRQEELLALADTIKLLNDDDALELFKKTLPGGASLMQVGANVQSQRSEALGMIRVAQTKVLSASPGLDFIAMALKGQKIGFDKVIKLIDDMVATLKKEQLDDDHKKEYCATQFDLTDDKKKGLEKSISDLETAIVEAKDSITTLTGEIDTLEDGISSLDKQVAEQTQQRKDEHENFNEVMSSNSAAKELLSFAKNRLNKFYNPKLYKPPASFLQIGRHAQTQPEAPPAPGAYQKKGEESNGVIAMIDALIRDLDKEITEAESAEKDSQADYEQAMADAKEKRADDSKALVEKRSTKAEMQTQLETSTEGKASSEKELMATESFLSSLHSECDFLLKYYDMRNEARGNEIDSLNKAKAVLSGADFSALQTRIRFLQKA